MNALEAEHRELRELVDGQESWSHRRRLHTLEDDHRAAELVSQALDAFRTAENRARSSKWRTARDWLAVAAAAGAVIVAIVALHYGTHVHIPVSGHR